MHDRRKMLVLGLLVSAVIAAGIVWSMMPGERAVPPSPEVARAAAEKEAADRSLHETQEQIRLLKEQEAKSGNRSTTQTR